MSDPQPTVRFAPDGPLIVAGLTTMRDGTGPVPCQAKMALCRCGGSQNKPLCDGAHAKNGFTSAKADERSTDKVDDYAGKAITIHDNRAVCAHAGRCTDGLPGVWRLKQEPWIDPDGADVARIIDIIRSCPSGALSYTLADGIEDVPEQKPGACSVFVVPGGPYAVSGEVDLDGQTAGQGANAGRCTLCRCGGSKNKPFCDGTHWNVKFDEAVR